MNLPSFKLGPKPKAWDLVAAAVLGTAAVVAGQQLEGDEVAGLRHGNDEAGENLHRRRVGDDFLFVPDEAKRRRARS